MKGARVEIREVTKVFGTTGVLDIKALTIEPGEFFALLGPSGSGKTTLLGAIAGFVPPTTGRVQVNGSDITQSPPHQRNLGMVFQNYSLFPFLSVARNVAFPLEMRSVSKAETRSRVRAALGMVRLSHMADRLPVQLSGGQQQRVALARATVYEPPLLLMDEPLGALDRNLREELQEEIRQLHRQLGVTIIFVTHDQHEAAAMADRIAVLRGGCLEQTGTPRDVYHNPVNAFVAGFLGEANLLQVADVSEPKDGLVEVGTVQGVRLAVRSRPPHGATIACIRPENVRVAAPGALQGSNTCPAAVDSLMHSSGSLLYRLQVGPGCLVTARQANERRATLFAPGDPVSLGWDADDVVFVPPTAPDADPAHSDRPTPTTEP